LNPADLSALPAAPGVYLFYAEDGSLLYIGKARSLRTRVRSYFRPNRPPHPKTDVLVEKVARVETIVTDSEVEALLLEATLVRERQPRYNIFLRDDKRFPFVKLTHEPFPRLLIVRRRTGDGARYFGPYVRASAMRSTLRLLHRIFPLRTCSYDLLRSRYRVCLQYHIGRCWGPCEFDGLEERYDRMIDDVARFLSGRSRELLSDLGARMDEASAEFRFEDAAALRDQIRAIEDVVSRRQAVVAGDTRDRDLHAFARSNSDVIAVVFRVREGALVGRHHRLLRAEPDDDISEIVRTVVMTHYGDDPDVPDEVLVPALSDDDVEPLTEHLSSLKGKRVRLSVPKRGERAKLLETARRNAEVMLADVLRQRRERVAKPSPAVDALQEALSLRKKPDDIVAFDVSHTAGRETVGAMVAFSNGKPLRSRYRSFVVRDAPAGDDYSSMREVVERAFRRMLEEGIRPDLCLIDGGRGQLSAARQALASLALADDIPVAALAKRLDEVFLPDESDALRLPSSSPALRLLQRMRDEVHRRAVTHHRRRRARVSIESVLDSVPGVGKSKSRALLSHFKSVDAIRKASADDIAKVEGIGPKLAAVITKHLSDHSSELQ
jgi:excinuclease ABC subunit C